jgi:GT2 family glycosyltransferase
MPVHHVPRASLDEALRELTRTGEQVVSIILDDNDRYEVTTRFAVAAERTETRPA